MGTAVVLYTRTGGVGVRNDGRGIRASGRAVADVYATANAIIHVRRQLRKTRTKASRLAK